MTDDRTTGTDVPIDGHVDPRFDRVREVFEASFSKGEVGAAVTVYVDGEAVVDLWGGWKDAGRREPWQRDTIVNTFSTTKGMTAICALRLVEAGRLGLDEPVATYWPEFAQNGKDAVTVRHVLTHQAGLPAMETDLGDARLDWDAVTRALAAQAPAWVPGTRSAYHAVTFGYLVGELVRRVDGRSLGTFFREEVADPLGADFLIGFGPEHDDRCAELLLPLSEEPAARMVAAMARGAHTRRWRAAEVPAANGHGTAHGVARVYAALARGGELDGVRVLERDTIEAAVVRQQPVDRQHDDDPAGVPSARDQLGRSGAAGITGLPFGLGFMLVGEMLAAALGRDAPGADLFGHPGAGGSTGVADLGRRMSVGYVMNQLQAGMAGGAHGFALIRAAYDSLAS